MYTSPQNHCRSPPPPPLKPRTATKYWFLGTLRIRSLPYKVANFSTWWTAGHTGKFIIRQAQHNWWIRSLMLQLGCEEVLRPGKKILAGPIWWENFWILLFKTAL